MSRRLRLLLLAGASALGALHCLSGGFSEANIRSVHDFDGEKLKDRTVLVLPIAVTDDLGDERTGIVLDQGSREAATRLACGSAAEMRDDTKIVCFDNPGLASHAALLRSLLIEYAKESEVTAERWRHVVQGTGADFVLLFRPEGVTASQRVTPRLPPPTVTGPSPARGWRTGMLGRPFFEPQEVPPFPIPMEGVGPKVDKVETERTYTLSSALVDLRATRIVRSGSHSAKATSSTPEAPDATHHLHGIMRELVKGLLVR